MYFALALINILNNKISLKIFFVFLTPEIQFLLRQNTMFYVQKSITFYRQKHFAREWVSMSEIISCYT